jgi:hypothetical protein
MPNAGSGHTDTLGIGDLIRLLEHPRALFIYHAGQRFSTINYFFVAFAIFAAAFVTTFTEKLTLTDPTQIYLLRLALAAMASFVTGIFWMLDRRNAELVLVDEFAQNTIEELIKDKHPGLADIRLVKGWSRHKDPNWFSSVMRGEREKRCLEMVGQYQYIMRLMYGVIFSASFAVAIWQFSLLL